MLPDAATISASLPAAVCARIDSLEVVECCASTNDLLKEDLPEQGQRVRLARTQTAGRGRGGRTWQTAEDALCFSVLHAHEGAVADGLALWVGVALAQTLNAQGFAVGLSWPNDLVASDQKLGGILLEGKSRGTRHWSVAGVGINVASVPAVDCPATALAKIGPAPDLAMLAPLLIAAVSDALAVPGDNLPTAFGRYDALMEKDITVETAAGTVAGRAAGIDTCGRLRVRNGDDVEVFAAADVRVRS